MSHEEQINVQTPFCERLRSKKYYFLDSIPETEEQLIDASGHCWCSQTTQSVGPDGFVVLPEDCRPGRDCYVSAV